MSATTGILVTPQAVVYDCDHMRADTTTIPSTTSVARLLAALPMSTVRRHRFGRDATVFRQGDAATAVFIVESGRIRLERAMADGSCITLHVACAGDSFAEASLSATHYHCDAVAEDESLVLALPKSELLAALTVDSVRCLDLTLALAGHVRDLRARLELRNIRSATARIMAWFGLQATDARSPITIGRPWNRIADELGLSKEAMYRALAELERRGRIRRTPGQVHVLPDSPATMRRTRRTIHRPP